MKVPCFGFRGSLKQNRPPNRALAVGKILSAADQEAGQLKTMEFTRLVVLEAVGLMAVQVDALRTAGDTSFQSEGGPGRERTLPASTDLAPQGYDAIMLLPPARSRWLARI